MNGSCWMNEELNTAQNLAQGKAYFDFDFTPVYPAEQIQFRSMLTTKYLKEIN
jgi:phage tail sheath protein FI